jgi:O-antigen ligase
LEKERQVVFHVRNNNAAKVGKFGETLGRCYLCLKIQISFLKFNFLNKNERSSNGFFIRRKAAVFFACLLVVSMMVSPFLLSVSMWGLVFVSFWETAAICRTNGILDNLRKPSAWGKILAQSFRNLFRQPPLALFLLLLIVPAASFFWSDDHVFWLERARVRLPFLVLPWVFANLPLLSLRQLYLPLYVLVWALTIICLVATINFALHFDEVLAGIGRGDPIPVPRSHIRFSLILAAGIVAGGWLWAKGFFWRWKWERWALAAALFFLFFFIHLLSVRSGIVGLYAVLLFSLGRYLWRTRRWGIGLIALAIIILAPMAAMRTLPSFEMRVRYMIWDWQQYQQNKGNTYSDAERIISLKVGWQLWQENPLLGVGAGDLPAEVRRVVNEKYPGYNDAPKLPHNQFVYILSGTGLIGLALSLVAFLAPIAAAAYRRFYLFAAFQILVFTSFLVEYTIETAIGVAFYLFYTLWFVEISRRY